ncbi:hypothetical protein [Paraburkholderia acidipaludis]|uniref:hypothetical protein n=1 Tax=Paraburkholderia acidipaludis TaxID=660537 RepID=UPI0005BB5634|nr:hypothetical protein [Paraburkholderia acidipaludis]
MRIRRCGAFPATALAAPLSVVLATISLSACGPDAGPSTASAGTPVPAAAAPAQTNQTAQTAAPGNNTPASSPYAADAARDAVPGQASAPVQSVEASLAADSRQIAPVLSYAPGDTDAPADDSRRTATTSQ